MKIHHLRPITALAILAAAPFAHAATITKANNTTNLNVATSWTGNVTAGAADVATWNATVTTDNSVLLGGNLSWRGITSNGTGGNVTISGANTLTLGKSGIDLSSATGNNLTINATTLALGIGQQLWNVASGRTLTVSPANFTRSTGATFNIQGLGTVATSTITNTNGIIGTWATSGGSTGTSTVRYATVSGGNITAYTGTAAATGSNVTSTLGTVNYDVTANSGTFGAGASVNTLRLAGAGTIGGNLTANGLLWATTYTQTATLNGTITIGSNNELVVTGGSGYLALTGVIQDNPGNASKLVITPIAGTSGAQLILSGNNTFTGGVVLNHNQNTSYLTLNNSNALGIGGALEIQSQNGNAEIFFNPASGDNTANYANEIKYDMSVNGATAGLTTNTANTTITLNHITGVGGGAYQHFRVAGNSTLVLAEGYEATGFTNGLRLVAKQIPTSISTIEFQKGISSTDPISFFTSNGSLNTLFSTAVTQNNTITNTSAAANTLGVTHATGNSTFNGAVTLANTGANALNLASQVSGTKVTFNGTLSGSADLRINDAYTRVGATTETVTNIGAVELSKSTGNTYTGNTTVYSGTLIISNTSGSATGNGSVSVQGGATLAGTGIIAPTGSSGLTVLNSGIIAPGVTGATGNLTINGATTSGTAATFSSGANFSFELNATTVVSDRLVLTNGTAGDFAFGGNTINFNILTGTITVGQQYILFSGTDPNQFAGLTTDGSGYISAGLTIGAGLPGAFGTSSTLQVVGNNIVLNAIPEPATWALLAFSLTTVMVLRRRRQS
jgi:hypothetical protein